MGARSKARKRALDVLYEADQRGADPLETLRERLAQSDPPVPEYAVDLVEGVVTHRERIEQNGQVFDFELSDEDMAALDGLDRTGTAAEPAADGAEQKRRRGSQRAGCDRAGPGATHEMGWRDLTV